MFFTSTGRVYRLKCYEIPEGSRTSKGMNIANLLPITAEEKVTSMTVSYTHLDVYKRQR